MHCNKESPLLHVTIVIYFKVWREAIHIYQKRSTHYIERFVRPMAHPTWLIIALICTFVERWSDHVFLVYFDLLGRFDRELDSSLVVFVVTVVVVVGLLILVDLVNENDLLAPLLAASATGLGPIS